MQNFLKEEKQLAVSGYQVLVKYDGDGEVKRFKGRLVAQGFSQKYGIDYEETSSPVARFSSIHTILAYAAQRGMLVHQMDVITAFLNGDLKEGINQLAIFNLGKRT